jgi:hypothetical protein
MKNPFKRILKDKTLPPQVQLYMPQVNQPGKSSRNSLTPGQHAQLKAQPIQGVSPVLRRQPQVATEQTMEFLKKVEPDDILELLFPRLVTDQKTRLEACTAELEEIDKELTRLHLMRDDVLNTQARQSSGVANF